MKVRTFLPNCCPFLLSVLAVSSAQCNCDFANVMTHASCIMMLHSKASEVLIRVLNRWNGLCNLHNTEIKTY